MIHPPTPTLAFMISAREVALPLLNAHVRSPTQHTPTDPCAQGYQTGEALESLDEWIRRKTTCMTDQFNQPIEAAEMKAPSVKIEAEAIETDAAVPLGLSYVRVLLLVLLLGTSPFPLPPLPCPRPSPHSPDSTTVSATVSFPTRSLPISQRSRRRHCARTSRRRRKFSSRCGNLELHATAQRNARAAPIVPCPRHGSYQTEELAVGRDHVHRWSASVVAVRTGCSTPRYTATETISENGYRLRSTASEFYEARARPNEKRD